MSKNLSLVDLEDTVLKRSKKGKEKEGSKKHDKELKKGKEYSDESLREYARGVINERIKFCIDYKKDEDLDRCVCEAVIRWVRLFEKQGPGRSKELGKLRVKMVEKVFAEMVKEGKIRCENINFKKL